MSKKKKLIARLKTVPKDFTFHEAFTLLRLLGYILNNAGKTSGSCVHFSKGNRDFVLHKPHPRSELKIYQIKELIIELTEEGLI